MFFLSISYNLLYDLQHIEAYEMVLNFNDITDTPIENYIIFFQNIIGPKMKYIFFQNKQNAEMYDLNIFC